MSDEKMAAELVALEEMGLAVAQKKAEARFGPPLNSGSAMEHLRKQVEWLDNSHMKRYGLPFGTMLNEAQVRELVALGDAVQGLTREDVEACQLIGQDFDHTREGARLVSLAARLAALLPPEG